MTLPFRPRRSLLFVPGANARALEKSASLAADGLLYDLEDSVSPEEKPDARERLRAHLAEGKFSGDRVVRINGLDTEWGAEDLRMAHGAGVDAVLLPKVETPDMLREVADALGRGNAPENLRIWAMIETPLGILDVARIAGASARLEALVVGPNDITLSTGIAPGPDRVELQPWLMAIVLAARAHHLAVLDGVYADFRNTEGFARECAQGRRMGFDGKTLIHPTQIAPANAAFAPEAEDIAWAERVVEAYNRPENAAKGAIQIDGRMVERLHLTQSERLLAIRDAIAGREGAGA